MRGGQGLTQGLTSPLDSYRPDWLISSPRTGNHVAPVSVRPPGCSDPRKSSVSTTAERPPNREQLSRAATSASRRAVSCSDAVEESGEADGRGAWVDGTRRRGGRGAGAGKTPPACAQVGMALPKSARFFDLDAPRPWVLGGEPANTILPILLPRRDGCSRSPKVLGEIVLCYRLSGLPPHGLTMRHP